MHFVEWDAARKGFLQGWCLLQCLPRHLLKCCMPRMFGGPLERIRSNLLWSTGNCTVTLASFRHTWGQDSWCWARSCCWDTSYFMNSAQQRCNTHYPDGSCRHTPPHTCENWGVLHALLRRQWPRRSHVCRASHWDERLTQWGWGWRYGFGSLHPSGPGFYSAKTSQRSLPPLQHFVSKRRSRTRPSNWVSWRNLKITSKRRRSELDGVLHGMIQRGVYRHISSYSCCCPKQNVNIQQIK